MEEVVVTSRRQEESVQDVPLSVTAFGEEAIERTKPNTLRDFDGLVPNVYIGMNTAGPGASALYIRGVGYADIEKTQSSTSWRDCRRHPNGFQHGPADRHV